MPTLLRITLILFIHMQARIIVGSLRNREVACSASDRQDSTFKSCVWKAVSSDSTHHDMHKVSLSRINLQTTIHSARAQGLNLE